MDARLGEIETALAAFEDRPVSYDPVAIARAGVFVSIDAEGSLSVDRGYVRPEDEAPDGVDGDGEADADGDQDDGGEPSAPAVQRAVITIGGQAEPEEDEDDAVKPLPDRLMSELTAYRTSRTAGRGGEQPACRHDGVAAQTLPRHLQTHRGGQLPRSVGAAGVLRDPARQT